MDELNQLKERMDEALKTLKENGDMRQKIFNTVWVICLILMLSFLLLMCVVPMTWFMKFILLILAVISSLGVGIAWHLSTEDINETIKKIKGR